MGPHPTPNSNQERQSREKMPSSPSQPLPKSHQDQHQGHQQGSATTVYNKIPYHLYLPETITNKWFKKIVSRSLPDPEYKVNTVTLEESKNQFKFLKDNSLPNSSSFYKDDYHSFTSDIKSILMKIQNVSEVQNRSPIGHLEAFSLVLLRMIQK